MDDEGNDDDSPYDAVSQQHFYNYFTNYPYDEFGQLTAAVNNDSALIDLSGLTYDPNGNIIALRREDKILDKINEVVPIYICLIMNL